MSCHFYMWKNVFIEAVLAHQVEGGALNLWQFKVRKSRLVGRTVHPWPSCLEEQVQQAKKKEEFMSFPSQTSCS